MKFKKILKSLWVSMNNVKGYAFTRCRHSGERKVTDWSISSQASCAPKIGSKEWMISEVRHPSSNNYSDTGGKKM
jgi:hypothetical protein